MGVVPVYFTINTWASKKASVYDARMDEVYAGNPISPGEIKTDAQRPVTGTLEPRNVYRINLTETDHGTVRTWQRASRGTL